MRIAGHTESFTGSASWLSILGASFYWAWVDHVAFMDSFVEGDGSGVFALSFLSVCACSILALVPFAFSLRFSGFLAGRSNRLLLFLGVGGAAGSLALFLSDGSIMHIACGVLLTGACFSGFVIAWGETCIAEGHRKALLHISSAWSAGLAINLAAGLLQPFASGIVLSLLPLASYGAYRALLNRQDNSNYRIVPLEGLEGPESVHGFDKRLLSLIFAFCAAFGIMYYSQIVAPADLSLGARSVDAVMARGWTALVMLALHLSVFRDRMHLLFKACSFILIVGFAAIVVGIFVPQVNGIGSIAIAAGYCGFDILVWTMVAMHRRGSGYSASKIICIAMLAEQAGILAGAFVGIALSFFGVSTEVQVAVLTGMNLVAVAALLGFTEYGSRLWMLMVKGVEAGGPVSDSKTTEGEDGAFAREHGLTERESEILGLFVTGRSMSYIADELVLSTNTVKTHVRHIYEKCGVHGKQELIDLVQKRRIRSRGKAR